MSQQDFVRQFVDNGSGFSRNSPVFQRLHMDALLLFFLLILSAYGLLVLYSASGGNSTIMRQITSLGVAFAGLFLVAQISPRYFQLWAPWFYVGGVMLLVAVLVFGTGKGKNVQRWLAIPGIIRFQPSELMKIILPLTVAWYLGERPLPPRFKHIFWVMVIIIIPVVLVVKQPDLGTALLIACSGLIVVILAGIHWRWIWGAVLAAIPCAWVFWEYLMKPYQKKRVLTLFNPEADRYDAGYQIIQSKIAIGSGGVYGKGWLHGTQSHLEFLPERHTDFIIAVLAEEFGLFGVLLLLTLYLMIVARGTYIAVKAQDSFSRLLAGGLTFTFFVYVFVNIGMVSGMLPVVGMPLPLVSFGGSSLVTLMLGFGVLMSVHTHQRLISR